MNGLHIIWFRNDLRVHDHAALRAACQASDRDGGEVLPLFIDLVDMGAQTDAAQFEALRPALSELRFALEQRGALLHLRQGIPTDVFSELHRRHGVKSVHVHETPEADLHRQALERWALRAGVVLQSYPQFAPNARPADRLSSAERWLQYMAQPRFATPDIRRPANVGIGRWATSTEAEILTGVEPMTRTTAIEQLRAFLGKVSDPHRIAITQTESGAQFYQKLEPALKLGVVSVREVWQAASSAHHQMREAGQDIRAASIKSLLQKLPDLNPQKRRSHKGKPAGSAASGLTQKTANSGQLSLGL